jgi:hypothetical protein
MTKEEIYLIKALIETTVRSVVKEVLNEQYNNNNGITKDIKQVKSLLVKVIKEGYTPKTQNNYTEKQGSLRDSIREAIGADFDSLKGERNPKQPPPMMAISEERGMEMSINGSLPNIDAPIPYIPKNSIIWKELKDKVM